MPAHTRRPGILKDRIAAVLVLLFCCIVSAHGSNAPTAEDVGNIAALTDLTTEVFNRTSGPARLAFDCMGRFSSPADRQRLNEAALTAARQYKSVAQLQRELKNRIEQYPEPDWEQKYGKSGLWRRLYTDLHKSTLKKCEMDFYAAVTGEPEKAEDRLRAMLEETVALSSVHSSPNLKLLTARTLALLGETDQIARANAKKIYDELESSARANKAVVFRAAVEKARFLAAPAPSTLDSLVERVAKSRLRDNRRLALSIVFLQQQFGSAEAFENAVAKLPEVADSAGSLILAELFHAHSTQTLEPEALSRFEAELAAAAALNGRIENYRPLFSDLIAHPPLRTRPVLYATAVASASAEGPKAVDLLIAASTDTTERRIKLIDVDPNEIAARAARLACNMVLNENEPPQTALKAFDNYFKLAGEPYDQTIRYLHAVVLKKAGRTEQSGQILKQVAAEAQGPTRHRAELDLIQDAIDRRTDDDSTERARLLQRLDVLIGELKSGQTFYDLYIEAVTTCCMLLLESDDVASSRKVMALLEPIEHPDNADLVVIKSRALQNLGQTATSLSYMVIACKGDPGHCAGPGLAKLGRTLERIEALQATRHDFEVIIRHGVELASVCRENTSGAVADLAGTYLAEFKVFAAEYDPMALHRAATILDEITARTKPDVDLARARARVLMKQSQYGLAAALWDLIAASTKADIAHAQSRPETWWRAKYYQLFCVSKTKPPQDAVIFHTIEVLENSYSEIPRLWSARFTELKASCGQQHNDPQAHSKSSAGKSLDRS